MKGGGRGRGALTRKSLPHALLIMENTFRKPRRGNYLWFWGSHYGVISQEKAYRPTLCTEETQFLRLGEPS